MRAATLATPDHLTPGPSRPCRKNVSTATLEKPRIAIDVNIPTCGIPCQGTFELDLAVRSREALPHGLRFEPLFASDRMLIVPRGHELAGKKRPTLRDLARHAFVIPPAG